MNWLERQLKKNSDEVSSWPAWMRRAANIQDTPMQLTKLDSLKNLRSWGFNVMDFEEYVPGHEQALERFKGKRLGLRTSITNATSQVASLPFHRDIFLNISLVLARQLDKDYRVIIYEWCPREWALLSGHVELHSNWGRYEVFRGAGVVRDLVEKEGLGVERKDFTYESQIVDSEIREIVAECRKVYELSGERAVVVEFSKADRCTGIKGKRLVFWEYRRAE